jgi:beta-lactamase regulating signal transducer with metallopeptidase domain
MFRRVLSARAKYLLWMLLALRLCLPVLPYSPFSLLGVVEQLPASANVVSTEAVTEHAAVYQAPNSQTTKISTANAAKSTGNTAPVTAAESAHTVSWQEAVIAIWVTGVVIFLLGYLALSLRTRRRLKQAEFVDDPETIRSFLTVRGKLRVTQEIRLCYGPEPLIGGLWKPILLIPRELSGDQLEAALTHELLHYRSGDLWIAAFQRILCCIYWFDPVVWLCFHQARLDCERACDQRVLEQGHISPALYAELLYTEGKMKTKLQVGTTAFGRQDLKARLTAIARFQKPALWMTILAVVLSLGVTACTLTGNEKAEISENADHQSELSSEENANSTEIQISGNSSTESSTNDQDAFTDSSSSAIDDSGPGYHMEVDEDDLVLELSPEALWDESEGIFVVPGIDWAKSRDENIAQMGLDYLGYGSLLDPNAWGHFTLGDLDLYGALTIDETVSIVSITVDPHTQDADLAQKAQALEDALTALYGTPAVEFDPSKDTSLISGETYRVWGQSTRSQITLYTQDRKDGSTVWLELSVSFADNAEGSSMTRDGVLAHVMTQYVDGLTYDRNDPEYVWRTICYYAGTGCTEWRTEVKNDGYAVYVPSYVEEMLLYLYGSDMTLPEIPEDLTIQGPDGSIEPMVTRTENGSYRFVQLDYGDKYIRFYDSLENLGDGNFYAQAVLYNTDNESELFGVYDVQLRSGFPYEIVTVGRAHE